jgi:hypothetical protein
VADATASTAADLVILALGQDWSTTNKGGGSYAAVQGGLEVSAGYINRDAKAESDTLYHQVQRRWAEANFGDPDLAPIREVVTNPPERDKAAAQMLVSVSQALDSLARHGADVRACMERFRIPLAAVGSVQVQAPAAPPSAPEQPVDEIEQAPAPDAAAGATVTIDLTATDIATVVTVDEARESIGLDPEGGDVGSRWVAEHSAQIKASVAPQIATVSQAEQGAPTPSQDASP